MAWRGGALLVAHEVTGRKHQSLGLLNKFLFYYSSTCNLAAGSRRRIVPPLAMLANLALRAAKRGSRRGEGRRMLFEGMLEGGIAAVGRGGRVPRLPKKGEVSKVVDLNNARTC